METVMGLPERPEPPSNLTEAESVLWRDIVSTKPADWFMRDSQPVLEAYCQAVVMHRDLMAMWHATLAAVRNPEDATVQVRAILSLKDLSQMVTKQAGLVSQLATKLRLTQQSRYTPQSANTASKKSDGRKLWMKA